MVPYNEADRRLDSCVRAGDVGGVLSALRGVSGAGRHSGPDGRFPIHTAAAGGQEVIVTALIRAGADPHLKSNMNRDDGGKAVHLASEGGHEEVIRALAAAGAHLDITDDKGRTPVHWAALRGQLGALVTLHDLGADLTSLDAGQANALHFAASSGSLEVVRWLVEVGGVSVTQLDLNSRSPYAIARRKGHRHLLSYLKQAQQNQQSLSMVQQQESAGTSAWVYRQQQEEEEENQQQHQHQHQQDSPSEDSQSQQESAAASSVVSQSTQHTLASRSRSQDLPTWRNQHQQQQQQQQNQHIYPPRPRSQQDFTAWSQHSSPQHSATWDRRQYSQRETSAWVRSQQQDGEPRSALSLLTQQCQDYRRKIAELEEREAQGIQRAAADQQTLTDLRKEINRLTGILQSEVHSESGRQIASLRNEIQNLTVLLNDTGRQAVVTQEAQQKRIEGLRNQEEMNKRTLTELTRRLALAEESNAGLMAEARERERTKTLLRGEVDRMKLSLSSAPNTEAYVQLQARAQRLSEQDTIHRQAILTLRRELEAARAPLPPPPVPTPLEQRRLREAVLEAEKSKEEAGQLSGRLREMQTRLGEVERLANSYKRQLGECERELREEKETNGRLVVSLREELAEMKTRMEVVKKKAITRSTSVSSFS